MIKDIQEILKNSIYFKNLGSCQLRLKALNRLHKFASQSGFLLPGYVLVTCWTSYEKNARKTMINLYHSRLIQQITNWWYFFYFPRKQDLTLHANCFWWRQCAWNVESCFLRKHKKKIFQNVACWKFYSEW